VATFTATLKTAGTQSITATDTANSLVTGSAITTVTATAASSLTIGGFPSPTTAGIAANVTVTALDAYGNIATSPKRSESAAFQRDSDEGVAVTLKHLSTSGE
jgi:hypothetical protein